MHPCKPGNHAYGSSHARTQEFTKIRKIEMAAPNDTESIQIAPRDYQKLEFQRNPQFSMFGETQQFQRRLMLLTLNHHIYYLPMGVKVENG